MIVRYGFYEGIVPRERRHEFDEHFRSVVMPRLAAMPGVALVRLLRGVAAEGLTPRFHHAIELTFPDEESLVRAMASEERRALQRGWWGAMDWYDGATPHANFVVDTVIAGLSTSEDTSVKPSGADR